MSLPAAPDHIRGLDEGRWVRLWNRLVKTLHEQGTYDGSQRELLERYVDAVRLAEFHQVEAEREPYTGGQRLYAHPGFAHSRAYADQARHLAELLVLTPKARAALLLDDADDTEAPDPIHDAAPVSLAEVRRRRAAS